VRSAQISVDARLRVASLLRVVVAIAVDPFVEPKQRRRPPTELVNLVRVAEWPRVALIPAAATKARQQAATAWLGARARSEAGDAPVGIAVRPGERLRKVHRRVLLHVLGVSYVCKARLSQVEWLGPPVPRLGAPHTAEDKVGVPQQRVASVALRACQRPCWCVASARLLV